MSARIERVRPGDLVTSGAWNSLVDWIAELDRRLTDLERASRQVAISGVTPASVAVGEVLTLVGRNFAVPARANHVRIDTVEISSFAAGSSDSLLRFSVPERLADLPRQVAVSVANPSGQAAAFVQVLPANTPLAGTLTVLPGDNAQVEGAVVTPGQVVELAWRVWSDTNRAEQYRFALDVRGTASAAERQRWLDGLTMLAPEGDPPLARLSPTTPPARAPKSALLPGLSGAVLHDLDSLRIAERVAVARPATTSASTAPTSASATVVPGSVLSSALLGGLAAGPVAASGISGMAASGLGAAVMGPALVQPAIPPHLLDRIDILDATRFPSLLGLPYEARARVRVPQSSTAASIVLRVRSTTSDRPEHTDEAEISLITGRPLLPTLPGIVIDRPIIPIDDILRPVNEVVLQPRVDLPIVLPVPVADPGLMVFDVKVESDVVGWSLDAITPRPGNVVSVSPGETPTLSLSVAAPTTSDLRTEDVTGFLTVTARRVDQPDAVAIRHIPISLR